MWWRTALSFGRWQSTYLFPVRAGVGPCPNLRFRQMTSARRPAPRKPASSSGRSSKRNRNSMTTTAAKMASYRLTFLDLPSPKSLPAFQMRNHRCPGWSKQSATALANSHHSIPVPRQSRKTICRAAVRSLFTYGSGLDSLTSGSNLVVSPRKAHPQYPVIWYTRIWVGS